MYTHQRPFLASVFTLESARIIFLIPPPGGIVTSPGNANQMRRMSGGEAMGQLRLEDTGPAVGVDPHGRQPAAHKAAGVDADAGRRDERLLGRGVAMDHHRPVVM